MKDRTAGADGGVKREFATYSKRRVSELTLDNILHTREVREYLQIVLWPSSWLHGSIRMREPETVAGLRPLCAPRGVFARACRNSALALD
jgi:hypothetical protein